MQQQCRGNLDNAAASALLSSKRAIPMVRDEASHPTAMCWEDILAVYLADHLQKAGWSRAVPKPADLGFEGGQWMPTLTVATENELHADGKIRIGKINPIGKSAHQLATIAQIAAQHLIELEKRSFIFAQYLKEMSEKAREISSAEGTFYFRNIKIDEVYFLSAEETAAGTPTIRVCMSIQYAVPRIGALPKEDSCPVQANLGHIVGFELFERRIARQRKANSAAK